MTHEEFESLSRYFVTRVINLLSDLRIVQITVFVKGLHEVCFFLKLLYYINKGGQGRYLCFCPLNNLKEDMKMYALLKAIEDGEDVQLCFASKDDAKRFKKFTVRYILESGTGNGYGAYWVYFDSAIIQSDGIPEDASVILRVDLIEHMLWDLLVARTADQKTTVNADLIVGKKNDAAIFSVGKLPPRQKPQSGDMFRVIRRRKMLTGSIREGRVLNELGDTLEVIAWADEDEHGNKRADAKVVTINVNQVMKINDWMSESRRRRNSPD